MTILETEWKQGLTGRKKTTFRKKYGDKKKERKMWRNFILACEKLIPIYFYFVAGLILNNKNRGPFFPNFQVIKMLQALEGDQLFR